MNAEKRYAIFHRFKQQNPHPTTELVYQTTFELLIAVMLSAQATDVGVNKATRRLFSLAKTPMAMLALGEEGLANHIKSIGLYRTKAKNIINTCRLLLTHFDSKVPDNYEELRTLPGVGRKTANVVLNTAFGHPTIAVDTHIFRVANRTGLAPGKDVNAVENILVNTVPAEFKLDTHHWLILHGRYVCKAKKPECKRCLISDLCEYPAKLIS